MTLLVKHFHVVFFTCNFCFDQIRFEKFSQLYSVILVDLPDFQRLLTMEGHRAGPFKQRNKAHKSGKKKSARDLTNGGRVRTTSVSSLRSLSSKGGSTIARSVRKNQLAQLRKLKREEILNARRGIAVAPVLVAVLNLADDGINESLFAQRLESFDSSSKLFTSKHGSYIHIEMPKFRTSFQVVMLNKTDLYGALDLAKIADILLLIHSTDTEAQQQSEALYQLEAIYNHCLPQTVHGVFGLDSVSNSKEKDRVRKSILELIERQYPGTIDNGNTAKLRQLDSPQDLFQFFHYCSNVKRKPNSYCTRRSQLLAEEIQFEPDHDSQDKGSMLVDGFIRNTAFNVNSLVYVPEFGEFQLETVEVITNPYQSRSKPFPMEGFRDDADPELRPSLDERENPVETLYEQEMADLGDGDHNDLALKTVLATKVEKRKLPKGTSDYQAAWIIDSDEEKDNDEENEEEESENDDSEMLDVSAVTGGTLKKGKSVQFAPVDQVFDEFESNASGHVGDENGADEDGVTNGDYDEEMNMEEEESSMAKFKEQRMYELFPDEIDTPAQVSARERFAKYRGLKSFRTSTWDIKENLPADYSRISQFQNFNRTKRRLFKTEPCGTEPGCYVRVRVINAPRAMFEYYQSRRHNKPLVLYQLLAHEHKMSVQNIVLKKVSSFAEPVQSKEELIFHLGCRRFAAKPIYSSHTVGDKHKYEKYLRSDVACVATIYAPITFPPTPVLVYKQYADGQQVLVATGSLLDCSPDRLVIKRYILSGHPFKINRRHAVVRYMFFNREDILWFRPVELRTKSGRVGHIQEPLGTHGHMKCVFDDQLTSQDTVLMCLYKRVFPKWSYRTEGISAPAFLPINDEEMTA